MFTVLARKEFKRGQIKSILRTGTNIFIPQKHNRAVVDLSTYYLSKIIGSIVLPPQRESAMHNALPLLLWSIMAYTI